MIFGCGFILNSSPVRVRRMNFSKGVLVIHFSASSIMSVA